MHSLVRYSSYNISLGWLLIKTGSSPVPVLNGEDVPETGLVLDHNHVHLALHTGPGCVLQTEAGAEAGGQTSGNIQDL